MKHLDTVFGFTPSLCRFLEEQRLFGIIYDIVTEMPGGEGIVGYIGALVDMGVHTQWGRIDNDFMGSYHPGCQFAIFDDTLFLLP